MVKPAKPATEEHYTKPSNQKQGKEHSQTGDADQRKKAAFFINRSNFINPARFGTGLLDLPQAQLVGKNKGWVEVTDPFVLFSLQALFRSFC